MAQGFQVFDASGNLILDVGDRIGRVLGIASYGNTNGSVTDSNLTTGTPFFVGVPGPGGSTGYMPTFSVVGTTLSWTWPTPGSAGNVPGYVVYGVY